jgi:hypothetical protein
MSDLQLVRAILENIFIAIGRIERRFAGIDTPDDFVSDDDGIDRLDGITMMLIAMGEQLKQLDTIQGDRRWCLSAALKSAYSAAPNLVHPPLTSQAKWVLCLQAWVSRLSAAAGVQPRASLLRRPWRAEALY